MNVYWVKVIGLKKRCCDDTMYTGGIPKFSANKSFKKILKVRHFALGFSLDENYDKN